MHQGNIRWQFHIPTGQWTRAVDEEFVYQRSLIHSKTQRSPDISSCNDITRAAMQNLDNQNWKSRISVPTKLKLYNAYIRPIFLYGCQCWAITKRDAHKTDAVGQWCLWKPLGIQWYYCEWNDDVGLTIKQLNLLAPVQARRLSLFSHTAQMSDKTVAKKILTAPP